ncbi:MAG: T9SS type A sorting domain-containing protein [Crocinitomicaceae bacterium]
MMNYKCTTLLVSCLCLFSLKSNAQELNVLAAAGNYTEGTDYSIAWTLGEVVTATLTFPDNHVTQGFHQSDVHVVGIETYQSLNISVYPNPTNDIINVRSDQDAQMSLYDIQGKLVQTYNVNSNVSAIDVSYLERGTYLLLFNANGALAEKMKIVIL